jgi:conjugal transfer pilus assembly protein TraA
MKNSTLMKVIALLAVLALPAAVYAGTGGTEFDPVWNLVTDWIQGSLGRTIAGLIVLIGVIAGIARQSLMALAVGIGGGVGLFYAPTVINATLTSSLPIF